MERSDNELMRLAMDGDEGAFDELTRRHERALIRFCWGMLNDGEEARDVVQDAFLQAWRSRERFNASLSFKTWIYTIARNRAISVLRLRKHRILASPRMGADPEDDPESASDRAADQPDTAATPREAAIAAEDAKWLRLAIERLDDKHRQVMQMKYFGGMKSREIADVLGLEVGTVWSRVHHGLNKLKSLLAEMKYEHR